MLAKRDLALTLDLIDMCLHIGDRNDLTKLNDRLARELGIESMILGRVCRFTHAESGYFFGINEEWGQLYIDNKYTAVDPVYITAMASNAPVLWADAYARSDARSAEFVRRSSDFNLLEGMSYAQKGYAQLADTTVVSLGNGNAPLSPVQQTIIGRLTPHIAEILIKPALWDFPALTKKETEVIKWCAVGKSYWEISLIMGISERTVKFHMGNIFRKLDVLNKAQAVARSLSLGYLQQS